MSAILRFTTNVPEEVSLRSVTGKRVEGRYGEQVMFSLFNDHVMYVPPIVADRIQELEIGAGEPFEICKAEARNGNRRWIEWRVRKYERQQQGAENAAEDTSAEASGPANGHGRSNGHAGNNAEFQACPDGTLIPTPVSGPGVTVMEVAMNAAAEIAERVQKRAALRNSDLQFTSEDVRAIGLTMFIQAGREGGPRWES